MSIFVIKQLECIAKNMQKFCRHVCLWLVKQQRKKFGVIKIIPLLHVLLSLIFIFLFFPLMTLIAFWFGKFNLHLFLMLITRPCNL